MAESISRTEQITNDVIEMLHARMPDDRVDVLSRFVAQYLLGVSEEDLCEFRTANLYGACVAHWNFAHQRDAGEVRVRAYNPQFDAHGWESTHTVVEVVCDDMPFLVDSVRMAMERRGLTVHLLIHPVMRVVRDADGLAHGVAPKSVDAAAGEPANGNVVAEAIMHFEVDRQGSNERLLEIESDVRAVLDDVGRAVADWRGMRSQLQQIIEQLHASPPALAQGQASEALEFLRWVDNNHFTFLGYESLDLVSDGEDLQLLVREDSGLGLLRGDCGASAAFAHLTPALRRLALEPQLLVLSKSNTRSTVHRPSYLDYIGVKQFDENGNVTGERRFLGLYTSAAYNRVPRDIPLLREKVERIITLGGYDSNSHAAKAIVNILDNFPRDEMFQLDESDLYETTMGILHLQERRRIRLFIHRDKFARFYSCLVYVPRERFNTSNRLAIQDILETALGAHESDFTVNLSESVLARLHFVMRVHSSEDAHFDVAQIEKRLSDVTRAWSDGLHESLLEHFGEAHGQALMNQYGSAFRADYRENYPPVVAALDAQRMEVLSGDGEQLAMHLYRPLEAGAGVLHFKLFHLATPVPLSDALPMLENMGFKVEYENPSKVKRGDGSRVWLHDFGLSYDLGVGGGTDVDLERSRALFEDAFRQIFFAQVENDGFNRLVLRAELDWRAIVVLRAYAKYLRQLGFTFSQTYLEDTLSAHPAIARQLIALFKARLDPGFDGDRGGIGEQLSREIRAALEAVENLDEDRILRAYMGLILATLRTNHYQRTADGQSKSYLSLKVNPAAIAEMPEPRPMFEIFVYSPRFEGVHLRGGAVARGGLRWSDRPEDFRTEVLGLVKAQQVKNAVIVPVGSKGGFFPKHLPLGDRDAVMAEGVACYQTFIRGLLDVTDNLDAGRVVPPDAVVRHDGDDPYLVVAADKGTATFSDFANEIALQYGFWLGDAFASGGSVGYDHKGMGITARGAWESVKRHFREQGLNTQAEDFSAVGVGDMSGDVFGNGMLLSRHIKLVGAFNHLHIFIDPEPDAERSFVERERMFRLPRSTWADFDTSIISTGGGVFSRKLKSIELNSQMRERFGIDADVQSLPPNELISAMLRAPVDLLWNGGIGTYVKASSERNENVGDRANDSLRVDARDLRCKVIGEGGNLGVTQLGRIEFSSHAGRVFSDAIDNSAGVDCSDHEVNIKVLLNDVVNAGDMTYKQRNELLALMTDEVGELVLRDNYLQTQALSMAQTQSVSMFDVHVRLIHQMERDGQLARAIEFLPAEDEIIERRNDGAGLFAPELSVLMAYVKIELFKELMDTEIVDDAFFSEALSGYFPSALREKYAPQMREHRLSREIIGTIITNEVVNRAGMTYCFRLREETGASIADVCRAYFIAREVFDMPGFWASIESLDNHADAQTQTLALLEARKLCERAARWLLRNQARPLDIAAVISQLRDGVAQLTVELPKLINGVGVAHAHEMAESLTSGRISAEVATRVSWFDELFAALDIVKVANTNDLDVQQVAPVYVQLGQRLELSWLRDCMVALPRENRWQALARAALRDDLFSCESALTSNVLVTTTESAGAEERIEAWMGDNTAAVQRFQHVLTELHSSAQADFAMLSVAMGELRALQRS